MREILKRVDSLIWTILVLSTASAMGIGLYLFLFLHYDSLLMIIGSSGMLLSLFAYAISWQSIGNSRYTQAGILTLVGISFNYLSFIVTWSDVMLRVILTGGVLLVLTSLIFFPNRWKPAAITVFLYSLAAVGLDQLTIHQRMVLENYPLLPTTTYAAVTALLGTILLLEIILLARNAKSIRNQLLRTFVSIVLLTGVYLNSFATINAYHIGASQTQQKLEAIAKHKEIEAITWYNEVKNNLNLRLTDQRFSSTIIQLHNSEPASLTYQAMKAQLGEAFERIANQDDNIDSIFLVKFPGKVIVSSNSSYDGKDLRNESFYAFSPAPVNTYLVSQSTFFDKPALLLTQNIYDQDGEIIGSIMEEVSLVPLVNILSDKTGLGETGESYLVDYQGRVHSALSFLPDGSTAPIYLDTYPVQMLLGGQLTGENFYPSYYDEVVIGSYSWMPALQLSIVVEQTMVEALNPIRLTAASSAGLTLFSIIIAVIATYSVTQGITTPLRYLVSTASRIASGDLDVEVQDRGTGELSVLSRAIQWMTNQLRTAIHDLRAQVSELQIAKQTISQARDEWERTFNTIPDLIVLLDKDRHVHRVNQTMLNYLQIETDDLIGKPCSLLIEHSHLPLFICPDQDMMTEGKSESWEFRSDIWNRDFNLTATPLFNTAGELVGSVHVAHDITEQKLTEDALLRANSLIAALSQVATRLAVESAPREVMETLGEELKKFGLQCFIGMIEPNREEIRVHYASIPHELIDKQIGFSSRQQMENVPIKIDEKDFGFSITDTRTPVFIQNIHPLAAQVISSTANGFIPEILDILEIHHNTPGMLFPLIVSQEVIGSLGLWGASLEKEDLGALAIFAEHVAISIEKSRLLETTRELATTDPLTGIHNRRYLFDLGEQEIQRAKRMDHPLSVMMLDLDHFKRINDTYGHAFGDQVLRELASRCGKSIREIDIIGRYGGEEFAIVLPHADQASAAAVALRLKDEIRDTPIDTVKGPIEMTISIGIAEWTPDVDDLATLLDRADTALYAAKNTGRNRIVTYPPPLETKSDRDI